MRMSPLRPDRVIDDSRAQPAAARASAEVLVPSCAGAARHGHDPDRHGVAVKVAFGSDERTPLTDAVRADLEARGHDVVAVGPPAGEEKEWAQVGREVGELVGHGDAATGVLFCWTGTGASIAANKVTGVRAALCTDAATAEGARKWNDANVLVMGLRLTAPDVAREMLDAWFATAADPGEAER
jgi:ribose 5-phosphate isomerase B